MKPAIAAALALMSLAPAASAEEFDGCQDIFVAPVFLATHAGTGDQIELGNAPPPRIEIRAKMDDKPQSAEQVLSPEGLAGDINAIGPLWPEKGSAGAWMPAKSGDTIDVRVVGYPARKETVLGSFRLHAGKVFAQNGYALFSVKTDKVFAAHMVISAWDGRRTCKGVGGHVRPRWTMPDVVLKARPAHAMLVSILRAHRCVAGSGMVECDLSRYLAEYRDVDGDKRVDVVILFTAPDGKREAQQIWMRDSHGELGPVFVGSCDEDLELLEPNVLRCRSGEHPSVIELKHGQWHLREPTPQEASAAWTYDEDEHMREARGTLQAIFMAETSFHEKWHRFSDDWVYLEYMPERGNTWSYYLAQGGERQRRDGPTIAAQESVRIIEGDTNGVPHLVLPPKGAVRCEAAGKGKGLLAQPGLSSAGASQAFTAVAIETLPSGELDCWSISSAERKTADGTAVAAGEPYHHAGARVVAP